MYGLFACMDGETWLHSRGNGWVYVPYMEHLGDSWGLYTPLVIMNRAKWWFQIFFFYFHPYLGKIPMLTNIFQMGGSTTNRRGMSIDHGTSTSVLGDALS